MVQLLNFDIPNFYLGGGVAGIVIIVLLFWFLFRKPSGRLGEEEQEESQTERLEADEKKVEKAQKDEKKVCAKMRETAQEIERFLRKNGMGEVADQITLDVNAVSVTLTRMQEEKMSLERAIETFKKLHDRLNRMLSKIPQDNLTINGLAQQLLYYQKREYKDLIKELQMDRDKKATLRRLWEETLDEERGSGNAQAA